MFSNLSLVSNLIGEIKEAENSANMMAANAFSISTLFNKPRTPSTSTSVDKNKSDDTFTLKDYIHALAKIQQLIDQKNIALANIESDNLKIKCDNYPEVFVMLGDLSKSVMPEAAMNYYSAALNLFPFDYGTELKLAYLVKKHPELATSKHKHLTVEDSLKKLKEFKAKQTQFIEIHQKELHYHLTRLKINDGTPLTSEKTKLFADDWTNGALRFAYFAVTAQNAKLLEIAQYYFERAILLYEHDFISKTCLAQLYFDLKLPQKAIHEWTTVAVKYQYARAYFSLYEVCAASLDYARARNSLMLFFFHAQGNDLDGKLPMRDRLTEFLQYNVYDKNEVKKYKVTKKTDFKNVMQSPTRLGVPFSQLLRDVRDSTNPEILLELNEKILLYPNVAALYGARALYHQTVGNMTEGIVDLTLAIWYEKKEDCLEYYYKRFAAQVINGNVIQARFNFDYMTKLLGTNEANLALPSAAGAIVKRAAGACLVAGENFFQEDHCAIADDLYLLGLHIEPNAELVLARARVMEKKGDTAALIALKNKLDIDEIGYSFSHKEFLSAPIQSQVSGAKPIKTSDVKIEEDSETLQKARRRRNKIQKPKLQLKTVNAPKKSNGVHITNLFAAANKAVESFDNKAIQDMFEQERLEKIAREEQKRIARNLKEKEKKRELMSQRKSNRPASLPTIAASVSEMPEPEDIAYKIDDATSTPTASIRPEVSQVELNEFEKKAFSLIQDAVPEGDRSKYKIYLVGGWAYDKVREKMLGIAPCRYNDADFVTNIPAEVLAKIKDLKAIPEVPGLFVTRLAGISIDIVSEPDLSNLLKDAKGRDFLTIYIDADGKVSDPTGFALLNLRHKCLSGVNPPADMFKEDPLIILRAIYTVTKRNLNINSVKPNILADRYLLVPRPNNLTSPLDRSYQPRRFNLRFAKLFTQQLATKNWQLLQSLGILEILFPEIYPDMLQNMAWLNDQIAKTNAVIWPRLSIIYATFIASVLMVREPALANAPSQMYPLLIDSHVRIIWNQSLLFQDAFASPSELSSMVQRPLMELRNSLETEPLAPDSTSPTSNRFR